MIALKCVLIAQAVFGQVESLDGLESLELEPLTPDKPSVVERAVPARPAAPAIEPTYAPGTHLYINATSLALRTGPKRDAGLIHYITKNERVTALEDVIDPVPLQIGSKKGQWLYIQHGQHKGYVFDAYLIEVPPSLDEALDWVCEPGKRVGPITIKTTYEDLSVIVGEKNLALARIPVGEGEYEDGTAVFPGDKTRELIIQWAIPLVKPKAVIVNGIQWKTKSGLGIGVRLSKIIEINEAPVSFLGFDWDYAGYVTSWRAGKLEKTHALRSMFIAYLAPEKPYLAEDYNALLGDEEYSSELSVAKGVNLRLRSMTILITD